MEEQGKIGVLNTVDRELIKNLEKALSEAVGLSEQTLIFVLGLFSIYPLAALYRSLVWNQEY